MLVSIPSAASAKLQDLLTESQRKQAIASLSDQDGNYNVLIRNTGANIVYAEMGAASATTTGLPIEATSGSVTITTDSLAKIQLIAATAPTDVRILIA